MGISRSTVKRLHMIPFASTNPTSFPMVNRINAITINPTMVVTPLARIELQDSLIASTIASWISMPLFFNAVKV